MNNPSTNPDARTNINPNDKVTHGVFAYGGPQEIDTTLTPLFSSVDDAMPQTYWPLTPCGPAIHGHEPVAPVEYMLNSVGNSLGLPKSFFAAMQKPTVKHV